MGLKIGILVFIACALLLWATFQSGSFRLGKEEDIVVRFPSVGGLEEGATVRLNGVPVGIVRDISLTPTENEVAVKLGVKRGTKARLHQGSSARITTVGFLAELYVELSGGDEASPPIQSDSEITPGMIADPAAMMNKVKTMADTLDIMLSNLNTTSRSIAQGKGTLGRLTQDDRLYEHMVSLTREATSLTARMNENQEKVSVRLTSLTTTLDSLTYQMQHGNGTVARLLNSDELMTPDSSRFWPAAEYEPGRPQASFDKQYVRDYCETLGWDKQEPGPELPDEVVEGTRARYLEAFERLTGLPFEEYSSDPNVVLS